MSSLGVPPPPLLAFFAVVLFYLYLSTYFPFKEDLNRAIFTLRVLSFILPALLIFILHCNYNLGDRKWFFIRIPKPDHDSIHRAGGSPWGVGVLLVLILIMVSYHSSVGSHWFRPLWYTHYY